MNAARKNQRGMTLVEVLVAFAILAGVVLGVMALISQNTRYIISAEERLLASIVADNRLTEDLALLSTPSEGVEEGEVTLAGRDFIFIRTVSDFGAGVQIEYVVKRSDGEQTLARVSALKGS